MSCARCRALDVVVQRRAHRVLPTRRGAAVIPIGGRYFASSAQATATSAASAALSAIRRRLTSTLRPSVSSSTRASAAGGIRGGYYVGQPVIVRDHLNLTGRSPLSGPEPPPGYPARFVDLTEAYSPRLRRLAREADPALGEGVYAALPGPHYETPAEIAMLRTMGADLVGMSTVMETIAARHLGAEVLAISLVTNLAAGLTGEPLSHAEVIEAGRASASRMGALLASVLPGAVSLLKIFKR